VIALRRPADYSPEEGARFEVHIEKARTLAGDGALPFEAAIEPFITDGGLPGVRWVARDLKQVARDLKHQPRPKIEPRKDGALADNKSRAAIWRIICLRVGSPRRRRMRHRVQSNVALPDVGSCFGDRPETEAPACLARRNNLLHELSRNL
jgi:hypothetical protein